MTETREIPLQDDAIHERAISKLSRKVAYILRHDPGSVDLDMSETGAVSLSGLAKALNVSIETIREIVDTDSKGRYKIEGQLIWAVQGHSISVRTPLVKLEKAGVLYHGTKTASLGSILKTGLVAGSRQHVHLSHAGMTAIEVAKRRVGASVILEIDGAKMLEEGLELFEAANGVILADTVPARFITISPLGV